MMIPSFDSLCLAAKAGETMMLALSMTFSTTISSTGSNTPRIAGLRLELMKFSYGGTGQHALLPHYPIILTTSFHG
jgi:hypothetical protein